MQNILILNAGSSSLKFKLFSVEIDNLKVLGSGQFSKTNTPHPEFTIKVNNQKFEQTLTTQISMVEILKILYKALKDHLPGLKISAIGHRVVHGGKIYTKPTLINDEVINNLKSIIYLTPIHLPHNIAPMEVCSEIFKGVPQVACFDTSFHRTIGTLQKTYAIPYELTEKENIERYGFHGLSYEYLTLKLKEINPALAAGKIIMAHLGAGASVAAINNGQSVDTTMGLTPLEGLVMATRCGSIDPSIILYLMKQGYSYQEIEALLYFKSGLLGVSGITADFATLSNLEEEKAILAFNLFAASVTKNILALTSTLQGIDAIVFAGGIGENSFKLRKKVLNNLQWLGVELDEENNTQNAEILTTSASKIPAYIIPTEEELMIAKHTISLLKL